MPITGIMNKPFITFSLLFAFIMGVDICNAQAITGVWRGKINSQRVELKIIQKGDSLTGTSYYHSLIGSVKRYSIKGYFDPYSNGVVWWDDALITGKGANDPGQSLLSVADFNCPGGSKMFLDGKSSMKESPRNPTGNVSLTKVDNPSFHDEWDPVLETWTEGGNDPHIIDSVSRISTTKNADPSNPVIAPRIVKPPVANPPPVVKATPPPVIQKKVEPTINELFTTRKKTFAKEIPIEGDSIELQFYDNAEVDGDSITLYLNNKMIFTHVRLTASPFVVALLVKELSNTNDLVMVAENMGAIPPNTAFMIAMVAGKRYEAWLESTEGSSSLIRFSKKN
ncbi:MAG: hypothetical protein JWQ09_121 [Segetibacter sp.]|nr:hypothetical protein [Segetibacter sp.]